MATMVSSSNDANGVVGGEGNGARCGAASRWGQLRPAPPQRLWLSVVRLAQRLGQMARDDPRRVAHSLKVGLALTLVSVVYYVTPLFDGFGGSAMWAVLTVVIVMEFTVGTAAAAALLLAY